MPSYIPPGKQIRTEDELDKFWETLKAEPAWYDFFYTELMTGFRRGEICGLKWTDINYGAGTLRVERSISTRKGGGLNIGETKTDTGTRTIILPPSVLAMFIERKKNAICEWIFPHLYNPNMPMNPAAACRKLTMLLKYAELPIMLFHDLRHTFARTAIENGMDIKILSAMIGYVSAETTLNIYSHITDTMKLQAAVKIDREIGGTNAEMPIIEKEQADAEVTAEIATAREFEPYKGKIRKSGTGCIYQISDHLWEGSFYPRMPDGKRKKHNVYAKTREECEIALAKLIEKVKDEIAEVKANATA